MEEYPRTAFCELGGHRLAYHTAGSGPAVVFLHGISTYSFIWRAVAPRFAFRYQVVSPDLLGCGASDMPLDESYALRDHATRLLTLADTLGLDQFHLVGHDLGGGIAQIFAVRHPQRLRSLTLVNSVGHDYWPVQPITAIRTPVVRSLAMASLDLGTFRAIVRRGIYHKDRLTPELMDLFWAPMKTAKGRKAFLHFARCLDNADLTSIASKLRRLGVPVLILRGDADVYLSEEICLRLHREFPDSRLRRISTGGHFIHEDEPNWVVGELGAFWEEVDA